MDRNDFCVTKDYTILEVMQVIDRNKERGVVVIGESGKVCGFISMGDIIYALAGGKDMYSHVGQICTTSFIYMKEKNYKEALKLFQKRNISLIPVIDEEMKLVDVITAKEMFGMVELR